jgi:hypothetical protein
VEPARLVGSVLLFAIGGWYAITHQARFVLGGNDLSNRGAVNVDAHGLDAVAIGCVFLALGLVNLALGIRGRARIPVFWAGAALLASSALYGVVYMVRDVFGFLASR